MSIEITWRWRRAAPGMVWVDHDELIEVQRNALRAHELEQRVRELRLSNARLEAQSKLYELTESERAAVAAIADQPPLAVDGNLHESAFAAAVDAAVWAHREHELARLGNKTDSTPGGQGE